MFVKCGVIERFAGSWGSGLGWLTISGETVPCENGPTVRALENAFGGVIRDGHTAEVPEDLPEVVWWMDDMGLVLGGFCLAEEWNDLGYPEIPDWGLDFDGPDDD